MTDLGRVLLTERNHLRVAGNAHESDANFAR